MQESLGRGKVGVQEVKIPFSFSAETAQRFSDSPAEDSAPLTFDMKHAWLSGSAREEIPHLLIISMQCVSSFQSSRQEVRLSQRDVQSIRTPLASPSVSHAV